VYVEVKEEREKNVKVLLNFNEKNTNLKTLKGFLKKS